MTGVEEAALLPVLGDAIGGFGGEAALGTGLGALEGGATLGSLEGLGGLGAMGAAGETAGTSAGISGGAASPFSLMMGNFNSMYPMAGKGLGLLGKGMQAQGLLGQQQGQAMASPMRLQGQAPETSSQILGNRFSPQSLMTGSQQQSNPQVAQLLQIMQGSGHLDPATLLKLRQQGIAI